MSAPENNGVDQIKFGPQPEKHKENLAPKPKLTPVEQWDQLAFNVIRQELAPKGFSEIKRGPYRGSVQANIPFLPKTVVNRCQTIAASLVRNYRDRLRKEVSEMMENFKWQVGVYEGELKKLPFYAFRKKRKAVDKILFCKAKAEILNGALNRLDHISIK